MIYRERNRPLINLSLNGGNEFKYGLSEFDGMKNEVEKSLEFDF
jgi:hypothetical protein